MKFMSGDSEQIHMERPHVHRDVSRRLDGVHMEEDPPLPAQGADAGNGLQRAHFVVGQHDGDQDRIRAQSREHIHHRHPAIPVHGKNGELDAPLPFQRIEGVQHRGMLHRRSDHMPALRMIGRDGPAQ